MEKSPNKIQEAIQIIKNLKQHGNLAFKSNDLTSALRHYYNGVLNFRSVDPRGTRADDLSGMLLKPKGQEMTDEQKDEQDLLKVQIYSNMAQIFQKQKKWEKCEYATKNLLKVDEKNVKGLFRQASAQIELDNYEDAERNLKLILEIDPSAQKDVDRLMNTLVKKRSITEKSLGDKFKGFFS